MPAHILAALLLSSLFSRPALAEPPQEQFWLGVGMTAGTTAAHALAWSLAPDRVGPMAVHFVPIAGPIAGFREIATTPCTDERHGCPVRGALVVYDAVFITGQVAGLTLMTVSMIQMKREQSVVRVAPGAVSVRLHF